MTGSSVGTNTACAACKYQRRKCTEDCPLSPYFPPDQPKRFQNVHKLFGVSNILRILKHVDPSKREDTIKSITYEADTREKDPVHGCLGVITILQNQVSKLKDELTVARDQLYVLQQQHNFNQQAQMQHIVGSLGGSSSVVNVSSAQETSSVLMQQLQQYNDINQLAGTSSSDFAKSNPLPVSSFEPDQYLRTDNFDIKPASTTRFDVARYIRGDSSPVQQQSMQLGCAPVKLEEQSEVHHQLRRGAGAGAGAGGSASSMQHYNGAMADSGSPFNTDTSVNHRYHTQVTDLQSDVDHDASFDTVIDPYATAIRRRGSSSSTAGLMNLSTTMASDSELRRATGGHHELRSAGVYLTLTNN